MCGDGWKAENGVLLFIYTPVITVSLASNSSTNIPLVARYHYPLSHYCSFGAVFALISFSLYPHLEALTLEKEDLIPIHSSHLRGNSLP